ncbi:MAG TPA: Hsp20/alpha crystallin family protein [Candidatus Limnocylindria bacterium]|nr:Hsp20/alpha crystallin family protein [Candidatus Limnocylindria bacterium]
MSTAITPLREFVSLRDAIDRLFEDSFIRPPMLFDGSTVAFSADLYETPEAYVLKAALPGMKPEDITVDATAGMVTIKGEYKEAKETKAENYLRKELRTGAFHRAFELPLSIEPAKVEAKLKDGVLEVALPKAEVVKPKQVKVRVE